MFGGVLGVVQRFVVQTTATESTVYSSAFRAEIADTGFSQEVSSFAHKQLDAVRCLG